MPEYCSLYFALIPRALLECGRVERPLRQEQEGTSVLRGMDSTGRGQPNKRLKLTARADYGMNCSSARRSLSAIR